MTPFVSVHMISKETTNLGREFINSAFLSLCDSYYPNELILVDNGSSDFIFDTYDSWKSRFQDFGCELKVFKSDLTSFSDLRNLCLEKTDKGADFFHWIDTDEVYYPEDLDVLKNYTLTEVPDVKQVWTSFYHFMINPNLIQVNPDNMKYGKTPNNNDARCSKDNIFRFHRGISWNKEEKVHEHVCNKIGTVEVASGVEYLHYGYCRQQYITTLKWLKYAMLEFGNINIYKNERITLNNTTNREVSNSFEGQEGYRTEVVEHMRSWRNPDNIVKDRRRYCMPYPCSLTHKQHLPQGSINLINGCRTEQDWKNRLIELDPKCEDFWQLWLSKYKETGAWSNTLEWAMQEAQKPEWNLY